LHESLNLPVQQKNCVESIFSNLDADFYLGPDDNTCTQVYMSMCHDVVCKHVCYYFFWFQVCMHVCIYIYLYILMCTCIAEVVGDRTLQEPFEPFQHCQTGRLALPKCSCRPPWLLYICIHVYNVCMCSCIYVSMYPCIYVSIFVCMYT